jgi:hypothetical protein
VFPVYYPGPELSACGPLEECPEHDFFRIREEEVASEIVEHTIPGEVPGSDGLLRGKSSSFLFSAGKVNLENLK